MIFLQALFWGFTAAAAAVTYEYLVRAYPGHTFSWYYLVFGLWAQPVVAYGIYRLLTLSTSLVSGVVTFTLSTAILRLSVQLFLLGRESVGTGNWIAFGLVFLAAIIKSFWR